MKGELAVGIDLHILRVLRLPPRLNCIIPSSGLLRGVRWCETDISVLPVGPVFKGQLGSA